jgi:hypothetical protein
LKLWRLPHQNGLKILWKVGVPIILFGPPIMVREGEDFGQKPYGIEVRWWYWEQPWGTYWEPDGNPIGYLKGTCWEQRKNEKKNPQFNGSPYFFHFVVFLLSLSREWPCTRAQIPIRGGNSW